ncbi:citrate/2-methylcitrate synthase [Ilumatobacter sp.]|uniref:citrate/2-methylcitrate synthase n=1 Tax=Ilumatobacter sp. TaxID=1967498 RepID=UPI003B51EA52
MIDAPDAATLVVVATHLRAPEAARRLGVTPATLYTYVSRGKVSRSLGADGRTSLFDLDEIEAMAARSSRPTPPPPSIDVRISTSVTRLDETGLLYRGIAVEDLLDAGFERVAELLWSATLPAGPVRWAALTPSAVAGEHGGDRGEPGARTPTLMSVIRLATRLAESLEDERTHHPDGSDRSERGSTIALTRALLATAAGGTGAPGSTIALGLARRWSCDPDTDPDAELVRAIDAALVLLADHELATSTLAVRVATSVRSSAAASLIAGLATVQGRLHGSASRDVVDLLAEAGRDGADAALERRRDRGGTTPGFGHAIYQRRDPRVAPLLERVRALPDRDGRLEVVEEVLAASGSIVAASPNVDLALGALIHVGGMPPTAPLFAIARIAGWTAHRIEELDERPLRFRGMAH